MKMIMARGTTRHGETTGERTRREDKHTDLLIPTTIYIFHGPDDGSPLRVLPYSASCSFSILLPAVASSLPELSDERAVILPLRTQ